MAERGTSIRAVTTDPVLCDRLHYRLHRYPAGFPRSAVRDVVEETKQIKGMIKNEKQTVFNMMDRGDGLHEKENYYGIYRWMI